MNYNRETVIKIIRKEYEKCIDEFASKAINIFFEYYNNRNSQDEWNESEHPRKENGQFGKGGGCTSKKTKSSERHNRVKTRQRKPLNMSDTEKAVLRDAVARNQFNAEEKEMGYATRYTSQYAYLVKIDNADFLSYTPISRSKNI